MTLPITRPLRATESTHDEVYQSPRPEEQAFYLELSMEPSSRKLMDEMQVQDSSATHAAQ